MILGPEDMPALVRSAEQLSESGQRQTVQLAGLRIAAGIMGAAGAVVAAATDRARPFAWGVAALFLAALAVESLHAQSRPDRTWYDGRVVAESGKSLAWLYAAGGKPFAKSLGFNEADDSFLFRMKALRESDPAGALGPAQGETLTQSMRALRAAPLRERRDTYMYCRIRDQQVWYSAKAEAAEKRTAVARVTLIVIEVAGLVLAVLWASGAIDLDASGFAGALLTGLSAWTSLQQYGNLAESYAVAAHELADVSSRLSASKGELAWSELVAAAESAISREHTMWLARRR